VTVVGVADIDDVRLGGVPDIVTLFEVVIGDEYPPVAVALPVKFTVPAAPAV